MREREERGREGRKLVCCVVLKGGGGGEREGKEGERGERWLAAWRC